VIWLGVLAAFAATSASALAIVLQASEARATPPEESARWALIARLMHRPRWLLGTLLLVLAWPLQVLALTFAPITVVQPVLACFQLILLALARFWLKERLGRVEVLAGLAIAVGVSIVIVAAPNHTVVHPPASRLAQPVAVVGLAALAAFALSRRRRSWGLWLALGAGLGYAWVDFANKLLSNELVAGRWLPAAIWVAAVVAIGTVAFVQENSALQRRSPVLVAPVIGSVQEPLPILMALWAGVEAWTGGAGQVAALVGGLALVGAGGVAIARSPAVGRVTGASAGRDTA
jgi:drug/metabolite transporter (DMT)-like permease